MICQCCFLLFWSLYFHFKKHLNRQRYLLYIGPIVCSELYLGVWLYSCPCPSKCLREEPQCRVSTPPCSSMERLRHRAQQKIAPRCSGIQALVPREKIWSDIQYEKGIGGGAEVVFIYVYIILDFFYQAGDITPQVTYSMWFLTGSWKNFLR